MILSYHIPRVHNRQHIRSSSSVKRRSDIAQHPASFTLILFLTTTMQQSSNNTPFTISYTTPPNALSLPHLDPNHEAYSPPLAETFRISTFMRPNREEKVVAEARRRPASMMIPRPRTSIHILNLSNSRSRPSTPQPQICIAPGDILVRPKLYKYYFGRKQSVLERPLKSEWFDEK
ncbi:hypothetical protein BDQ17DRAFT_1371540 [Cyathus striatus]|nr:hypothetical protein BDQ17DRAFT_1371540 [Cyathus striatus]